MMACQSSSATPFYVAPNFENEDGSREAPSEPLVDSIGEMFDLPVFRLSSPSPDQLAILGYLQAKTVQQKELIQHARDEGLKFITDTSLRKPKKGSTDYSKHTSSNRSANRATSTSKKTVAKSVSTSMITDEMRSGYSPTQRSNDLIAGVTSGSRPGSGGFTGSTWSPSQPNIIYERAEL